MLVRRFLEVDRPRERDSADRRSSTAIIQILMQPWWVIYCK